MKIDHIEIIDRGSIKTSTTVLRAIIHHHEPFYSWYQKNKLLDLYYKIHIGNVLNIINI